MNTIRTAQAYFYEQLNPQFDKEEIENYFFYTLSHFLNMSRNDIHINGDKNLSDESAQKIFAVAHELKSNKPIQYILGETEFYGLKFFVV